MWIILPNPTITSKAVISAVVDSMKNAKIDYKKYGYKRRKFKIWWDKP